MQLGKDSALKRQQAIKWIKNDLRSYCYIAIESSDDYKLDEGNYYFGKD